jgi:hypothetical protein
MEEEPKKNFWGKLKTFFKGEEEKPIEEPKQEQYPMPTPESTRELKECFFCKEWIQEGDRWSKQQNNWFHKKCYKKFLQAGRRGKL